MKEGNKKEAVWYVVKVHSGFEEAVKSSIAQVVELMDLQEKVREILIPTEKQVRVKGGKRTEKQERIYPGYILVRMVMEEQTWYAINNIEHVSGFLGSRSHAESLSDEEVDAIKARMLSDKVRHETDLKVGDAIKIVDGPFADLDGKVGEVDVDKGQVTVLVPMFGRETPVKLDLFQIRSV